MPKIYHPQYETFYDRNTATEFKAEISPDPEKAAARIFVATAEVEDSEMVDSLLARGFLLYEPEDSKAAKGKKG
jgi:hypothetical protein